MTEVRQVPDGWAVLCDTCRAWTGRSIPTEAEAVESAAAHAQHHTAHDYRKAPL